ncbi:MurR/RpiR family transcriptional regulator [Bradyrhizobium paxllaeri]|uniref:MurR/RpiR family transcriptional regulator n=1 Tax=Bradyrhizobium paxllaeri TaxID=190148 RepID=UPI000A575742|nr:MurR/RpiR family transcriptional regulator [Bradyrhizobium paxllaeri]
MTDENRKPRMLEKRIHGLYDDLPGSERALADLILEFPGDLLVYSATELSERGGVSKAAVTRFVQRLGYQDYREMQREVREAQEAGEPIYLNTGLLGSTVDRARLQQHLERDVANLRQTLEAVNPDDLREVVRRCLTARRVWVLGFRNSYFFAAYIRRQLIQVRSDVTLVPAAGQVLMEDLGSMTPEDLMIAVGLRRRTPTLGRAMQIVRDLGVPIAYITDRVAVTTPKLATWTFPCQVRGMSLFDSYVGVMSLANYLCTEIVSAAGERGREQLNRIEDLMGLMGEIDPSN